MNSPDRYDAIISEDYDPETALEEAQAAYYQATDEALRDLRQREEQEREAMSRDPDKSAFPYDAETVGDRGMSLRDYFAGQALAGYLAAHADAGVDFPEFSIAASEAYEYADAMIEARQQ